MSDFAASEKFEDDPTSARRRVGMADWNYDAAWSILLPSC